MRDGVAVGGVRRGRGLVVGAAVLAGSGISAVLTAFSTYITRYSRFDGLHGSIDEALYLQITTAAPVERAAILGGLLVLALAAVLLVVHRIAVLLADPHNVCE